jgi:uncharacterized membrane protein
MFNLVDLILVAVVFWVVWKSLDLLWMAAGSALMFIGTGVKTMVAKMPVRKNSHG